MKQLVYPPPRPEQRPPNLRQGCRNVTQGSRFDTLVGGVSTGEQGDSGVTGPGSGRRLGVEGTSELQRNRTGCGLLATAAGRRGRHRVVAVGAEFSGVPERAAPRACPIRPRLIGPEWAP